MKKINGLIFAQMIDLGARNLAKNAEKINSLNVFPVPDGDTGTNMNLSMTSGATETRANTVESIGKLGKSFSKGLLMGARGNSGVILSQLFRGLSQYIEDKDEIDAKEFAAAVQNGVTIAYKAVMKPVEGTILTVARESAEAGVKASETTDSVIAVMEAILAAAQKSLQNTPELLPILKEVGVVDSGGQGLVCVYQGFLAALKGEEIEGLSEVKTDIVNMTFEDDHSSMDFMSPEDIVYGFCTEFTVRLEKDKKIFNEEKFREDLSKFGDSLLVIADNEYAKTHIHTERPGDVFNYGQQYGELIKIKSENMREQHREVLRKEEARKEVKKEKTKFANISVSMGSGLSELMKSLGANFIVEGGQTMNPSTEDMVKAIEAVNAENIYILPNNKNIQLAAKQAAELVDENVYVVETKTAPQGVSALMVFNPELTPEENYNNMQSALNTIKTLEVTYAVRDTNIQGVEIKESQYMGILDGKIICANEDIKMSIKKLFEESIDGDSEILTMYLGEDSDEATTNFVQELIETDYPDVEIEVVESGQPVYPYVFGIE